MHRCQHLRQYNSGGLLGHPVFVLEVECKLQSGQTRSAPQVEAPPEEANAEASKSFKAVQLRLLMKEREDVVARLVELDYTIWTLEEFFRTGSS